jgi:hypothetical protein
MLNGTESHLQDLHTNSLLNSVIDVLAVDSTGHASIIKHKEVETSHAKCLYTLYVVWSSTGVCPHHPRGQDRCLNIYLSILRVCNVITRHQMGYEAMDESAGPRSTCHTVRGHERHERDGR